MSCNTLNTQAIQLSVTVGNLPEGFCPASMQELANAIGARIIISPSATFNTFSIGSVAPTSNTGPWLKNCNEWFVYDDATASYIPLTKGGFNTVRYFTLNGTFTVPDFIYKLKVSAWGAGAGGSGTFGAGTPGSGGGAGGFGMKIFDVTPGQAINFTVGTGGGGGAAGAAGGNGGATSFLTLIANGGTGAPGTVHLSAAGGTVAGADYGVQGGAGDAGDNDPGAGGDSSQGGTGGVMSQGGVNNSNGIAPGGGGSGGQDAPGTPTAGNGAIGGLLIEY